jgi:hypothetical protein
MRLANKSLPLPASEGSSVDASKAAKPLFLEAVNSQAKLRNAGRLFRLVCIQLRKRDPNQSMPSPLANANTMHALGIYHPSPPPNTKIMPRGSHNPYRSQSLHAIVILTSISILTNLTLTQR